MEHIHDHIYPIQFTANTQQTNGTCKSMRDRQIEIPLREDFRDLNDLIDASLQLA
jgi:hypothetical protein